MNSGSLDLGPDALVVTSIVVAVLAAIGAVVYFYQLRDSNRTRETARNAQTIYELTQQVVAASSREEVCRPITSAAPQLCDASHAYFLLVSSADAQLVYAASTDDLPRSALSMSTISGAVTCVRSRETTEVPDSANCPFADREIVTRRGQKSALYVPVTSGETCLGVIEIEDRRRKRHFTPEQRARAEHLARLAALALRLQQQRAMTEQLHRTERLAAVVELTRAIEDELSAPFQAIREAALQLPEGADSIRLRERLREVAVQVERAADTIGRLVRFAGGDDSGREELDLNALIRNVVADLRRSGGVEHLQFKLGLTKRPPLVFADPAQMQQIFQILLRHALHFLEQINRKSLQIYTARREKRVVVSMTPEPLRGPNGALSTDSGPGSVTGAATLGLSICQGLIERAGGSLLIEPNAAAGFSIELEYPLGHDPWQISEPQNLVDSQNAIRTASMTALIIDPDATVRQELVRLLSEQSYRAVPVSSGEQALELARKMRFDWVFCDLRLHPVSAAEIYDKLSPRAERFVFLADDISASQNPEIFGEQGRLILQKPFTADDFDQLIETLLRTSVVFHDG
jgi:K+-sensing histidine kinase KdpD